MPQSFWHALSRFRATEALKPACLGGPLDASAAHKVRMDRMQGLTGVLQSEPPLILWITIAGLVGRLYSAAG